MIWWVSWKGEVRHQPDEPHRRGGGPPCIDPKDAPAEFDPAEEEWLQMVLSPTGDLRFVRLAVEDGGWKSLGVLPPDEAMRLAERWERTCEVCGSGFELRRTDARYCSGRCRQRARRRRS
jgi:hypothetical protein